MAYTPEGWVDGSAGNTPLSAARLKYIEDGLTAAAAIADAAQQAISTLNAQLATVAKSGSYNDLNGEPVLAPVATTGAYSDLTGRPSLATVASSGSYTDLTGKPTLATVATTGAYTDLSGTPALATVATTGSYNDLTNTPAYTTPQWGNLPASSSGMIIQNSDSSWPARPTTRTDVHFEWVKMNAGSADPAYATTVGSSTDGAYPGDVITTA